MKIENILPPDSIRAISGNYVNIKDPDPSSIIIEDIAHGLAAIPRFGGHTRRFYSVAQHCFYMCRLADKDIALTALMHDASEAYLLDIPSPIKKHLPAYQEMEDNMMKVIAKKFGFEYPIPESVRDLDEIMLYIEWYSLVVRDDRSFTAMSRERAAQKFMETFIKLTS